MISTFGRRAAQLTSLFVAAFTPCLALAAPAPSEDIHDIRGPIHIPPWWHWPLAAALAAAATLGIVFFVRWWRRRSPRVLSPIERARQSLTLAEAHAREGRSREWADLVAETLRGALATRLGTTVLPQTTAELSEAPWTKPPLSNDIEATRLLELLDACDLARFAKARLGADALLASTTQAREVTERLFTPSPHDPGSAPVPAQTVPS